MQRNPLYKRELLKRNTRSPMSFLGPVHLAIPIPTVYTPSKDRDRGKYGFGDSPRHGGIGLVPVQKRRGVDGSHSCMLWEAWGRKGTLMSAHLPCSTPHPNRHMAAFLPAQWVGNQRENFKLSVTNTSFKAYSAEFFHRKPGSWADEKPAVRGITPETFSDTSKSQGTYETTTRNSQGNISVSEIHLVWTNMPVRNLRITELYDSVAWTMSQRQQLPSCFILSMFQEVVSDL